ncbi:MAG TPA: hypothetical protein VIL71_10555, partial [Spirillospora sp.]
MTMRRMVAMAGGAVAPIALLALIFNNQWVADAVRDSRFGSSRSIGPLVAAFQFPKWRLTAGPSGWKQVLVTDFVLLLFLALLAALVFAAARAIEPRQGLIGTVVTGWWAATVAGAVAGLVGGILWGWSLDLPGSIMSQSVWGAVNTGTNFGALFGWIAGLGVLGGSMFMRSREAAQQPFGGQQPFQGQQPYGAQQPYGGQQPFGARQPGAQPPQQQGLPQQGTQPHPSAVPYVPPQGQAQQPPWGGPAVPGQPGAPGQPGGAQQPGAGQPFAPAGQAQQPPVPASASPGASSEPERAESGEGDAGEHRDRDEGEDGGGDAGNDAERAAPAASGDAPAESSQ